MTSLLVFEVRVALSSENFDLIELGNGGAELVHSSAELFFEGAAHFLYFGSQVGHDAVHARLVTDDVQESLYVSAIDLLVLDLGDAKQLLDKLCVECVLCSIFLASLFLLLHGLL